jgi:hypothetical protein
VDRCKLMVGRRMVHPLRCRLIKEFTLRQRFRSVIVWPDDNPMTQQWSIRVGGVLAMAVASATLAGCDPVINIAGANFPAWLLCAIVGAVGIALIRPLLLYSGLDPYLWWRPGFYSGLVIMIGCLAWIVFFNR